VCQYGSAHSCSSYLQDGYRFSFNFECKVDACTLGYDEMNMSIHTIHLRDRYSKHEVFRGSFIPYLETNRLRSHPLVLQKKKPVPYRVKVLGRALVSASTDVTSFRMFYPECRSCLFVDDCDNQSGCEPPYACCCCHYYNYCCCCHFFLSLLGLLLLQVSPLLILLQLARSARRFRNPTKDWS
jgi:hypothetical protein